MLDVRAAIYCYLRFRLLSRPDVASIPPNTEGTLCVRGLESEVVMSCYALTPMSTVGLGCLVSANGVDIRRLSFRETSRIYT